MTRLSHRALNRATLKRQLLTERHEVPAADALRRLVGVQAQDPDAPYIGLWTRLVDFRHDELTGLLRSRSAVRGSLLRGTQHIACAADFAWIRPFMQPVLDRGRRAAFGRSTQNVDLADLATMTRRILGGTTMTRTEIGQALARRWPTVDPMALGWSAQALVPVVHPAPHGTWRRRGRTSFALAEEWLDGHEANGTVQELVRRYLAAFGPASVADVQQWSGLTRLREVVDAMPLRRLTDQDGRALVDLPDIELPAPGTPLPVRFIPAFDNLLLAHADRTRLISDERRARVCVGAMVAPTVLVDGEVAATWKLRRDHEAVTLEIAPFERLRSDDEEAVTAEGTRLLDFAATEHQGRRITWTA